MWHSFSRPNEDYSNKENYYFFLKSMLDAQIGNQVDRTEHFNFILIHTVYVNKKLVCTQFLQEAMFLLDSCCSRLNLNS